MRSLLAFLVIIGTSNFAAAEPIKIGIQTSLTGDAATFGTDVKNAIELASEKIAPGKYKFIYEDEHCDPEAGVRAAQKLVSIDKVKYVLGFSCNNALLASAPIYERAKVVGISATASSGDKPSIGKYMFRLFPNDALGVETLIPFIAKRHKHLGILTETSEYPTMMERASLKIGESYPSLKISSEQFLLDKPDYRSLLLRMKSHGVDALYINTGTESPFAAATRQARALKWDVPIYTVYFGGSKAYLDEVGPLAEGVTYSDLPNAREYMGPEGKAILDEFVKRYGEPKSFEMVTSFAYESFRILDEAISSGRPVEEYLSTTKFNGNMLGSFHFDQFGQVVGPKFQIKRIENGKPRTLAE
jgi:branched-chain amino acid transport system substrate-binding protein